MIYLCIFILLHNLSHYSSSTTIHIIGIKFQKYMMVNHNKYIICMSHVDTSNTSFACLMLTHQIHHLHTLHAHINSPQPNDTKMHISQFIHMHTYIINIIIKDTFYKDCSHLFKKFVNHNLQPISYKEALYGVPKYLNTFKHII